VKNSIEKQQCVMARSASGVAIYILEDKKNQSLRAKSGNLVRINGHVAYAPCHDECSITSGFTRHHERMRSDPHFRDFKARLPRSLCSLAMTPPLVMIFFKPVNAHGMTAMAFAVE